MSYFAHAVEYSTRANMPIWPSTGHSDLYLNFYQSSTYLYRIFYRGQLHYN